MTDEQWKRVQEIIRQFKPGDVTLENFESLPDSVMTPPDPATARQINYLRVLGHKEPTTDLTKQEACQLIAGLLKGAT